MIQEKYRPYPKYKPAGVEWIGDIPEGWGMRRWRFIAKCNPTKSGANIREDLEVQFVPMELVPDEGYFLDLSETRKAYEVNNGYTYFINGDVLVAKITPCFENGKGAIAENLINGIGFGTTELHVYRVYREKMNSKYLFLISKLKAFRSLGEASMKGAAGQKRVTDLFIKDFLVPLPPLPEQQAIADFFDRETLRINSIVEKQTRMIELLKEKRSALITHAVTKGLDPKAKMKDSGVEWIGEIPEGWEVRKIKWCLSVSFANGVFKKAAFFGSGTKLINVFDIYKDNYIVDYASLDRVIVETNELKTYSARDGDVFFVRSSLKEEGVAAAACLKSSEEDTVFECHLIRARPNNNIILSTHLIYQLNSSLSRQRQVSLSQTVTMTTIAQPKLGILEILIPKIDEQKAIVTFLDRETAKIDMFIGKIEKQIELLNEYKQSLITHAVTGKIDVRGKAYAQNT